MMAMISLTSFLVCSFVDDKEKAIISVARFDRMQLKLWDWPYCKTPVIDDWKER